MTVDLVCSLPHKGTIYTFNDIVGTPEEIGEKLAASVAFSQVTFMVVNKSGAVIIIPQYILDQYMWVAVPKE